MPDLFVALTAKYLDEHRTSPSPAASDEAMQWMEQQLSEDEAPGDRERYLIEAYLALDNDELQALPSPVHDFFLDRWALAGPGTDDSGRVSEIARRIAEIFLAAGPGLHQATAVACLLEFDRVVRGEVSHLMWIVELLARVPADRRGPPMEALVESLLDRLLLSAESGVPLAGLRDLVRSGAAEPYLSAAIRRRADLVGEPLRNVLDELAR